MIIADQATKAAILATVREGDAIAVTPFFSLVLTFNTGAAFSFLSAASGWQRWFFIAIAVVATVVWLLPAVNTDHTIGRAGPLATGHIYVHGEDYFAAVNGRT